MSKILIEIILHNDSVSDEKINELLNQEDWKERASFSVKDSGEIGLKKSSLMSIWTSNNF